MPTGGISFRLAADQPGWEHDGRGYDFGTVRGPGFVLRARKQPHGPLEIDLLGLLRRYFVFRRHLVEVRPEGLSVTVCWTESEVHLLLNNVLVETQHINQSPDLDPIEVAVEVLGRDWVMNEVRRIRPGTPDRATVGHEFCIFYKAFLEARQDTKHKLISLPINMQIAKHIVGARHVPGFERVLTDLRNRDQFRDTVSEVILAHSLSESGEKVHFQPPSQESGRRTSDLIVMHRSGAQVRVECKRVHDYNSALARASGRWPNLHRRVAKALKKKHLGAHVYVRFRVFPDEPLVVDALKALESVRVGAEWQEVVAEERFAIWTKQTSEGTALEARMEVPDCADMKRVWVATQAQVRPGQIKGARSIGFELDIASLSISGLQAQFRSAIGQLAENGPGIVGIEIPQPREGVAPYLNWLNDEFQKGNYTRVNRVYLFWIRESVETYVVDGEVYQKPEAFTEGMIVDHPQPRCPLPLPGRD